MTANIKFIPSSPQSLQFDHNVVMRIVISNNPVREIQFKISGIAFDQRRKMFFDTLELIPNQEPNKQSNSSYLKNL